MSIVALRMGVLACVALLVQPVRGPANASQSVRQVGQLRTARAAHTAVTLASGQVLVVGGMASGGGSIASVELYDPTQNTVRDLASLNERRAGHTATVLDNGRVLIAGGYNGEYLASLEIFEPSANRFRHAGTLSEGRSGHTATLMPDGRVLFVGGVGRGWTFLKTAELYDPGTGRFEPVGSMVVPRESHTTTLLATGQVLVVGGHTGRRPSMEVHASAEVFSLQTRRFQAVGSLDTPRHKHDAVRLGDGRVLVLGGADRTDRTYYATTEIYSPRTATFERGPSMAYRRYKIAGTSGLLPNNDVLVTSGAVVAELLDVARWEFREVPGRFPAAYHFAATARLPGGDVLIAGGYSDANRNTAGIWRFGGRQ